MQINGEGRIVNFVEKPSVSRLQAKLTTDPSFLEQFGVKDGKCKHLGSMGVYVFNRQVLIDLLSNEKFTDFGREVIPDALGKCRVFAYVFDDFWEDIGTIESYYRVNLSLTDPVPPFNFYKENWPIHTHPRSLPGVKVVGGRVERAILCEGCIVNNAEITRSIVGVRQIIRPGSKIRDSLILGADYYESAGSLPEGFRRSDSEIPLGIGHNVEIEGAIIDKNTRIGDGVVIRSKRGEPDQDGEGYYVRSGIVIVPRGEVIEPGRVI